MREELIANCLHLSRRIDREESAIRQAKEQGYYLRFIEGIEIRTDRKQGICLGHKSIIRDAKENGYPMVCVLEDDTVWFASGAWDYFLENIPEDFDIYFSMCYVCAIEENRIKGVFSGMTCYIVHERFYDFFLSIPDSCHIDRHLGLTANIHKYIVCPKFVCYQFGGKSDNNQMIVESYDSYLVDRKIYGKD